MLTKALLKTLDKQPPTEELKILKGKFVDYCIMKSLYPVTLSISPVEVYDLIQLSVRDIPRWNGVKTLEGIYSTKAIGTITQTLRNMCGKRGGKTTMDLVEQQVNALEALEQKKKQAEEDLLVRTAQPTKQQRTEPERDANNDSTEKSISIEHSQDNGDPGHNQIDTVTNQQPQHGKHDQVEKEQQLIHDIIQLHKVFDSLKGNRRERKALQKEYRELLGKFPAFNIDPLADDE